MIVKYLSKHTHLVLVGDYPALIKELAVITASRFPAWLFEIVTCCLYRYRFQLNKSNCYTDMRKRLLFTLKTLYILFIMTHTVHSSDDIDGGL